MRSDWVTLLDRVECADELAASQARIVEAELTRVRLVEHWCDLHSGPVDPVGPVLPGAERSVVLGACGTPPVREFAAGELGLLLGLTTTSTRSLMRDVLDLRQRHPPLHRAVLAGDPRRGSDVRAGAWGRRPGRALPGAGDLGAAPGPRRGGSHRGRSGRRGAASAGRGPRAVRAHRPVVGARHHDDLRAGPGRRCDLLLRDVRPDRPDPADAGGACPPRTRRRNGVRDGRASFGGRRDPRHPGACGRTPRVGRAARARCPAAARVAPAPRDALRPPVRGRLPGPHPGACVGRGRRAGDRRAERRPAGSLPRDRPAGARPERLARCRRVPAEPADPRDRRAAPPRRGLPARNAQLPQGRPRPHPPLRAVRRRRAARGPSPTTSDRSGATTTGSRRSAGGSATAPGRGGFSGGRRPGTGLSGRPASTSAATRPRPPAAPGWGARRDAGWHGSGCRRSG